MNPRLAKRPQWHGFPVPFFATERIDGTWDFKVISERNRARCAQEHLCWVCGEGLLTPIVFLGGPESTKMRLYTDGPMHPECADDALALCPFMIGTMDYAQNFDLSKHKPENAQGFLTGEHRPDHLKPPEQIHRLVTNTFDIVTTTYQGRPAWFFFAKPARSITIHPRSLHAR